MSGKARKKGKAVRHRSPVPPPSRVIDKTSYRRSAEKSGVRRRVEEEL